jgi:Nitrous oxidase accessory protein
MLAVILLSVASYAYISVNSSPKAGPFGSVGVSEGYLNKVLIASDGSVNSSCLKQVGDVYIQTGNISDKTIIIQKNGVTLDGGGYNVNNTEISLDSRDNITIRNLNCLNTVNVRLNQTTNCLITNNTVTKTPDLIGQWLYLENSSGNVISQNNLDMANIELMFSSNNTLSGNRITNVVSSGAELIWSQNNTVDSNYFEKVLIPVEVDDGNNTVSRNTMVNCNEGVRLMSSNNTAFANNMTFSDMGYRDGDWMTGIVIEGSSNKVYGNTIQGYALAGIIIEKDNNEVFRNIIACNNYGVLVGRSGYWPTYGNQIYHNDFLNNNQSVLVASPNSDVNSTLAYYVNQWDNSLEGNYWSDYSQLYPNATAVDNSGVMDTPYTIDDNNSDIHPLMEPFMQENTSAYVNPDAGQTPFRYDICQIYSPGQLASPDLQYSIYVEFYNLPPNVTLTLDPSVPIADETTFSRGHTYIINEVLPPSVQYTATVTYGDDTQLRTYSWNFTSPAY